MEDAGDVDEHLAEEEANQAAQKGKDVEVGEVHFDQEASFQAGALELHGGGLVQDKGTESPLLHKMDKL